MNPTGTAMQWRATVIALNKNEASGDLLLKIQDSAQIFSWQAGDQILVYGKIQRPGAARNLHEFDYAKYLKYQGIYGLLYLKPDGYKHIPQTQLNLLNKISRFRKSLIKTIKQSGLQPNEAGLAQSMLLGYRALDPEQYRQYQKAGAAHILAVSGLHVGILSTLLGWLLLPLRRLKHGALLHGVLLLILLWIYVLLAGGGPSVLRAAVLFSLLSYAFMCGKMAQSLHFWALAILFLTGVIDPRMLFQTGFQLSFAAVWAILIFYPKIYGIWPFKRGVAGYFGQLNSLGLAAQLGVLPLTLFYFHEFPMHFLLSNLLLVPGMGLLLGCGYIFLILSALNLNSNLLIWGYNQILSLFNATATALGQMDGFICTQIPWDITELLLSITGLLVLGGWIRLAKISNLELTLLCILSLFGYRIFQTLEAKSKLEVLIPHNASTSSIWVRQGQELTVFSNRPESLETLIKHYSTGQRIRKIQLKPLANAYTFGTQKLLVIDAHGVYPKKILQLNIVLLTQSPPVHLAKVLEALRPAAVIADGTNYPNELELWHRTCSNYGIAFYATTLQGAFIQSLSKTN
ncbi:MAG: hypothetical protein RLZZ241_2221 [Bacteroidota bacterium]